MSYELRKPITDKERMDFIVQYNHKQGLKIEDTKYFIFALERNEIMGEKEIEIDVPDNETVTEEYQEPVFVDVENEDGYFVEEIDHYETKTRQVEKQTGSHKETITVPYPVINPNYEKEQLIKLKAQKSDENLQGAKQAVEQGYVEFRDAQFETNAQTVGDLTATMLLMQSAGLETYTWLSRDDKAVDLTLEDFATLGGLIAGYKNTVWNDKYLTYKNLIERAKTLKALEKVVIEY